MKMDKIYDFNFLFEKKILQVPQFYDEDGKDT